MFFSQLSVRALAWCPVVRNSSRQILSLSTFLACQKEKDSPLMDQFSEIITPSIAAYNHRDYMIHLSSNSEGIQQQSWPNV